MVLILSNNIVSLNAKVISWNERQNCNPSIRNIPLSNSQYIDTGTWTLHPRTVEFEFRASNDEKDILKELFDYKDIIYATLIDGEKDITGNEVIYLPFCEGEGLDVFDYSGSGYNGVIYGATWTEGIFGNGLMFSGDINNNYVATDSFLEAPSKLSLSAWVNLDSEWVMNHTIISKYECDTWGFIVKHTTGELIFAYTDNSNTLRMLESDNSITFNKNHHIGVTYDGSNNEVCFYIDGQIAGKKECPHTFGAETNPVFIGHRHPTTNTWRAKGIIDDVRAWSKVLSPSDMKSIAKYGHQMWIYRGWMSEKSINYDYRYESSDKTIRPWNINITMDVNLFDYTGK